MKKRERERKNGRERKGERDIERVEIKSAIKCESEKRERERKKGRER